MTKISPNKDPEDNHDKTKRINKGFRPYVETESSAEDFQEVVSIASDQPHQKVVESGKNQPNNSVPHAHGVQAAHDVIDFEEIEPVQHQERNLVQSRLTMFGITTTGNQIPFHVICRECGWKLKNGTSKKNERGRRCHKKHLDRLRKR